MWVIDGVLKHGINEDLLLEVARNFKRIKKVPEGYNYPQLYSVQLTNVKRNMKHSESK